MEYLSPSGLKLWQTSPQQFYLQYLASNRLAREPQNKPMSIGSAFDAYVKSALYHDLSEHRTPELDKMFNLKDLFEAQVEPQNREWAWENGEHAYKQYCDSGAYADLLTQLRMCHGVPRFETKLQATVGKVMFLGKPDVYYKNNQGHPVILDWKVNGYCGSSLKTPYAGYVTLREVGRQRETHKTCMPVFHKGVLINSLKPLDQVDPDWAQQLAIYAWLLGEPIGGDFVTCIHQLACGPGSNGKPRIRIAEHCCLISESFQRRIYAQAETLWLAIQNNHFFHDVPKAESDRLCVMLEGSSVNSRTIQEAR